MNNDTKTTLLAALPLLVIITALVAALVILPQTDLDTRDKAAEPQSTPTPRTQQINPNVQLEPETACSTLYSPVCGTNNVTYSSECEANQAGIKIAYRTSCTTTLNASPSATPSAVPTY